MTENLIYKIKSFLNPGWAKKDFSFYIQKLSKMAPLTFEAIGKEKLQNIFASYFQELVLNVENPEENIFYLPIFLKKYATKFKIDPYIIELSDYEFSCYQIINDPTEFKHSMFNDLGTEVYSNPAAQALRLNFDIHGFVTKKQNPTAKSTLLAPEKTKNLLLISKNPETQKLIFLKGELTHAAIIDELHDGKMIKKDLIQSLQTKFSEIPQRDWIVALKDLKSNFIIIEK